jgi:hypothetical protein
MGTKTIAYFRNGLGNFVLFTPALQALASLDESKRVDVCIDGAWIDNRRTALVDIIKALPFVEDMQTYPDIPFEKKYTTWFWTKHTYPSEAYNVFKCKEPRFDTGVAWVHSGIHEIDFYMGHIRRHLGFAGETPKQFFPVAEKSPLNKKRLTIGICNGSFGHLRPSKAWPYFPELAATLKMYYDCDVVKVGYEDELKDVILFDHDFVGKTGILETAAIIKQCDLFITTDTCNMHVADALNVPMIVIWGGSVLTKNRPVNGNPEIVTRSMGCQPCHETQRELNCIDFPCLRDVSVGQVMAAVRGRLS